MTSNQHRLGDQAALPVRQHPVVVASTILALASGLLLGGVALWLAQPAGMIVLAIMAILAVIGVFTLLGAAAGLVRLSTEDDAKALGRRALESAETGLLVTDPTGQALVSNRAAALMLGGGVNGPLRSIEEAFGADPLAAEGVFRLLRAAERGETKVEELRIRTPDGRRASNRWLRISVRPLPGTEPDVPHDGAALWQFTDLTQDRARAAETLRALEARVERYEHLPVGLIEIDAEGRILEPNLEFVRWLGADAAALADSDLHLADALVPGGYALVRAALAAAKGGWGRAETELVNEAGETRPVTLYLLPAGEGQRGRQSILLLPRLVDDSTGRSALGTSESGLARLLQAAPFGVATIARDGRIVTANVAFASMFGAEEHTALATIADAIGRLEDANSRLALGRAIEATLAGRLVREPIEVTTGRDGRFTRRLLMSPLAGGSAHGEAAVVYVLDATEQKSLELMFAQSTKMEAVGKLAGGIAHDFNNVLTAIMGSADLVLQNQRPTDPAYREMISIKQSASRAAAMVRQLLAFSRRQTLQPEILLLGDVVSDTTAMLRNLIGETVTPKVSSERDLWFVKADPTQLVQVLMNLAVNARDAMPDGGTLTLATRNVDERLSRMLKGKGMPAGEYVEVTVSDTGHGMSPEILAKIFEPFFTTKDVGKGTGLGLSTVYGIVKQTGGYIFADSTLGQGTTFRIYLPRYVPTAAELAELKKAKQKPKPRDLTGTGRVLIVEDEDIVRNVNVKALQRQGYEVLQASSGQEALEVFERETRPIDIIVSDVIMPEMDGPTLLREIRKRSPDMKFIFVSGYSDEAFKRNLDPDTKFAFLQKPFGLPQLAAKVKEELTR